MKRLAFLSFTIATLIAPIQVQAQQYPVTNCVTFPQNSDPESEVRYLLSHPNSHDEDGHMITHGTPPLRMLVRIY